MSIHSKEIKDFVANTNRLLKEQDRLFNYPERIYQAEVKAIRLEEKKAERRANSYAFAKHTTVGPITTICSAKAIGSASLPKVRHI